MFNLIRRISGSVIPRPDRPWRDDATSNAPQTGRKRRLSTVDGDHEQYSSLKKFKAWSWGATKDVDDAAGREESPTQQKETEEVKEVTEGVKEVVLEDSSTPEAPTPQCAPTPPPESQVEDDPLEADEKDGESEGPTPDVPQPVEPASETAQAVETDSAVPEAMSPQEPLDTTSPIKTSTLIDINSKGATNAEEVEAPPMTTAAAEEGEDKGESS